MKSLLLLLIFIGFAGSAFADSDLPAETLMPPPYYKLVNGNYYDDLGFGLHLPDSMDGFLWNGSIGNEKITTIQIHPESNFTLASCCAPIDTSPAVIVLDSYPLHMLTTPVPLTGDLYAAFQGYGMNLSIENLNGTEVLASTLTSERDDLPGYELVKRVGKFYFMNTGDRYLSYGLYASPEYYAKYIDEFEKSAKSISLQNAKPVDLDVLFNYPFQTQVKLADNSIVYPRVITPSVIDAINLDGKSLQIHIDEPNSYPSFLLVNIGNLFTGPYVVTFDENQIDGQILENKSGKYMLLFYQKQGIHDIDITGAELQNDPAKRQFNAMNSNSPLKLFKSGFANDQIPCKPGYLLVIKSSNGYPACIKSSSFEKLLARNWGDCAWNCSHSIPENLTKGTEV